MIPVKYQKVYTDATTYHMLAIYEDGSTQIVDEQNMYCAPWLAAGNVPEKVAGNKYVTFDTNGTPIYDSTTAAADAAAAAADAAKPTQEDRIAALEAMVAYLSGGSS